MTGVIPISLNRALSPEEQGNLREMSGLERLPNKIGSHARKVNRLSGSALPRLESLRAFVARREPILRRERAFEPV